MVVIITGDSLAALVFIWYLFLLKVVQNHHNLTESDSEKTALNGDLFDFAGFCN